MTVKENLNKILKEIEKYNPTLIAVTKYYDAAKITEAYEAGLRNFAESRALDAIEKISKIDDTTRSQSVYHFIGHLQTNKVKYVVGNFEYIHSVDSLKLAECIDAEAKKQGIEPKDDDELQRTMAYLRPQLKALVARDLWDMSEYYQIMNEYNDIVMRAVRMIETPKGGQAEESAEAPVW